MVHPELRALRADDRAAVHVHLQLHLIRIEQHAVLHSGKIRDDHAVIALHKARLHLSKAHLCQVFLRAPQALLLRQPLRIGRLLGHHPQQMRTHARHLHAQRARVRLRGEAKRLKRSSAVRRVAHAAHVHTGIARRRLPGRLPGSALAGQPLRLSLRARVGKRSVEDQRRIRDGALARDRLLRPAHRAVPVDRRDGLHRLGIELLAYAQQMRVERLAGAQHVRELALVLVAEHASVAQLHGQRQCILPHLAHELHRIRRALIAHGQLGQPRLHMARQQRRLPQQGHALRRARGDHQLLQIDLDVRHRGDDVGERLLTLRAELRVHAPVVRAQIHIRRQRQAQRHAQRHRQNLPSVPFFRTHAHLTPQSCGRRWSAAPRATRSTRRSPSRDCNSRDSRRSGPSR